MLLKAETWISIPLLASLLTSSPYGSLVSNTSKIPNLFCELPKVKALKPCYLGTFQVPLLPTASSLSSEQQDIDLHLPFSVTTP